MSENPTKLSNSKNVQRALMDLTAEVAPSQNPLGPFIDSGNKDKLEYYQKIIHEQQLKIQEQQRNLDNRLGDRVMQNQFEQIHITPTFQQKKPFLNMDDINKAGDRVRVLENDSFNKDTSHKSPPDLKMFLLSLKTLNLIHVLKLI